MTGVLHITPHLGGGVGRALAGLVAAQRSCESPWRHEVVCLETPEKLFAVQQLQDLGCRVHIAPDDQLLSQLAASADVVQLEWWQHPVLFQRLCTTKLPELRLLIWCHINGLHTPLLPANLLETAQKVLFTSGATCNADNVKSAINKAGLTPDIVHSCAGFSHIPPIARSNSGPLQAGYLGSLNFSKLNPNFVDFLAAVDLPGFSVDLFGDGLNWETLQRQTQHLNCPNVLNFRGWSTSPSESLASFNVMPYLLNSCHYGTTENALLEAMAAAVVPVVLDHPVETSLVQDQVTGLVVHSHDEFSNAMKYLHNRPDERRKIGMAAAQKVRQQFTPSIISKSFDLHYGEMISWPKTSIDFSTALGSYPSQYFLSAQKNPEIFTQGAQLPDVHSPARPSFHEKTKGSVFHFQRYFPQDPNLQAWAERITRNNMPFFSCPICKTTNDETILHMDTGNLDGSDLYPTVRLVCCQDCGHAYNNITQTELDGLYRYYNEEYAPINLKATASQGDRPGSADSLSSARYTQLFQFVKKYLQPNQKILDVGCAVGGFLTFLENKGFADLYGVDMTETYVQQARTITSFPIELGQAESLPYADNSFDFLVLEQVLEHLINPGQAFQEAGRVLRPGGHLCIGVPDAARYEDCHFFDYYWVMLREHIQHFDINHLQQLGQTTGFKLKSFRQTEHAVMSDKMIMPTLYAVFQWSVQAQDEILPQGSPFDLKATLTSHLENQASLLAGRKVLMERLAKTGQPVFIWGVGREFVYLHTAAELNRCNLQGLLDLNQLKQDFHAVGGLPVSAPTILEDAPENAILLITAVAHTESITAAAQAMGFKGEIISFADFPAH